MKFFSLNRNSFWMLMMTFGLFLSTASDIIFKDLISTAHYSVNQLVFIRTSLRVFIILVLIIANKEKKSLFIPKRKIITFFRCFVACLSSFFISLFLLHYSCHRCLCHWIFFPIFYCFIISLIFRGKNYQTSVVNRFCRDPRYCSCLSI